MADTEGPKLGENEKIIGDSESSYQIHFNERIRLINDVPITAAAITVSIDQGEAVAVGSAVIGSDEKSIEVALPELRAGEATLRIEGSLVEDYSGNSNSEQIRTPITVEDRTPPQLAAEQEDLLQWSKFYKLSFADTVVATGGLAARIKAVRGSAAEEGISSAVLLEDERTLLIEFATRIEEALGENVVIRVLAGAVGDQAGNQNEELSHSLTVKADSEGPVLERVEEIREEDSHGRLWFNEPLAAGTPPLEATVTVDGQSTQQAITIATDPSMIEVALPAISVGQELSIVIEAERLQDLSGNKNEAVNVPVQQALPENTAPEVKSSGGEIEDSAKLYQIEFSEAITAVEGSELAEGIRISVDGRSGLVTATASIRGETSIEIALPELSAGEELVISIEEGIVQDKRSNVNAAATLNPITVVDTTAPRLLEEQDEIVESVQYVIRFHEELRIDDDIAAKIKVSTNGGAAAGVNSVVLRDDSKSLLIELSSAPQVGESLVISIEAGAISDQHGNANEALTLPAKTVQADSNPPTPLSEQDAIYEDTKDYHIRFDEQLRMVSDEAALAAGITLTANGNSAEIGGAYIDSTEKNIVIKMPALTLGEEIVIRIGAGIVADRKGNENGAAELGSKTVLADITPPELDEDQDALKDVDQQYRVRLNEAVTLAGSEQDLAGLITIAIDGEDFSVSGATLEGETVLLVELPAIAAGQTVVIRIAANAVKDKRDNANLDLRTAQLIVQDTTPPRMLEVQEQFTSNFNGRVEFNEDIFLVEGKTIDDFKSGTHVQAKLGSGAFDADMNIEGNSIVFRGEGFNRLGRLYAQGGGFAYFVFPGNMLQDRAGNVIKESITSPYYFS
ncbi:MAG: hypothetical protein AB2692_23560, partial [Candidatus Thiodiazotropha sp.]